MTSQLELHRQFIRQLRNQMQTNQIIALGESFGRLTWANEVQFSKICQKTAHPQPVGQDPPQPLPLSACRVSHDSKLSDSHHPHLRSSKWRNPNWNVIKNPKIGYRQSLQLVNIFGMSLNLVGTWTEHLVMPWTHILWELNLNYKGHTPSTSYCSRCLIIASWHQEQGHSHLWFSFP